MRVLSIDFHPSYQPADLTRFTSDTSCFDYDLVIWDPRGALDAYQRQYPGEYRGLPRLDESSSVASQADIARRRAEFREFVEGGRTLIVIVRPRQAFYFDTGGRSYSGTGKNRQTTVSVDESDIWDALPLDVSLTSAAGRKIQSCGVAEFSQLWRDFRDVFAYVAIVSGPDLTPVFTVAGTNKMVGAISRWTSGGSIVLLPAPNLRGHDDLDDWDEELSEEDGDEDKSTGAEFQRALCDLARLLSQAGDVEPAPEWSERYRVAGETAVRNHIALKEREVQEARAQLAVLQSELDQHESRKRLITGTGKALELEVRKVLEALGGEVNEPEPGRDDWKVLFPEGSAVVEVKGLNGSAGEKDAAQLEKWVANHLEETGESTKGLLVVNGWRGTAVSERTQPVFPDQMLKYSVARGHCLVSGLQMLGILGEVEAKPARAAFWRKQLLKTDGQMEGMDQWETILEAAPDAAQNESDEV